MQITLRRGMREYQLRAPFCTGHGGAVRFLGVAQAYRFLSGFHSDPHSMEALRRLLDDRAGRGHGRQWTDQQVLEELARWLAHGKLGATGRRLPVVDSVEPLEEKKPSKAPFAPKAKPVPRPEPKKEPPPPEPDLARQVATLKTAAGSGAPFCEECQKKAGKAAAPAPPRPQPDAARQADTLRRAAEKGAPFCEECQKKQQAKGQREQA